VNKTTIVFLLLAAVAGYVARDNAPEPTKAQALPVGVIPAEATEPPPGKIPRSDRVEWVSEAEAKASGKTVLYLATLTKGCVPCTKLKGLLTNPASVEAMNRFACVLIEDPSPSHPWVQHYEKVTSGKFAYPALVFVGPQGTTPQVQVGSPDSVPALLQFLDRMEARFSGKALPELTDNDPKADKSKTSITYPPKPTLAAHDAVAPFPTKGRSSGRQERSCVKCQSARGRSFRSAPGVIGQWTFRPGMGGRR
jgi:hypothetical protein